MRLSTKHLNLLLLALGFGIGQGSLFLANTYLYWTAQYELVAGFGSANSVFSLLLFVGDWGGSSFLAKEAVGDATDLRANEVYVSLTAFRFIIAIGSSLVLALLWRSPGNFITNYLCASTLGLLANAMNPVGLLDGRARSGVAGLTQVLPSLAVAAALPLCVHLRLEWAGFVLGAVTSVATIGATAAQFAMARVDLNRAYRRLSIFSVFSSAFAAAPYFMTPLPGNLLYRGQIYFANTYLTSATVALFVYARQIIGVGYQGYNFFLRSDFREFAQWLRSARPSGLYILYNSNAIRFACAIVLAIVFVSAVLYEARPTLAILLFIYSVSIIASSTSSVLQRVFLLINQAHINVFVLTLSTVIGVIYMRFAINSRGIYSLLVCEIFAYTLQTVTLLALLYLKRMPIPQANPT